MVLHRFHDLVTQGLFTALVSFAIFAELSCAELPVLPHAKLFDSEDEMQPPGGFRNGAEIAFECIGLPDFYFDVEERRRRQTYVCMSPV